MTAIRFSRGADAEQAHPFIRRACAVHRPTCGATDDAHRNSLRPWTGAGLSSPLAPNRGPFPAACRPAPRVHRFLSLSRRDRSPCSPTAAPAPRSSVRPTATRSERPSICSLAALAPNQNEAQPTSSYCRDSWAPTGRRGLVTSLFS